MSDIEFMIAGFILLVVLWYICQQKTSKEHFEEDPKQPIRVRVANYTSTVKDKILLTYRKYKPAAKSLWRDLKDIAKNQKISEKFLLLS